MPLINPILETTMGTDVRSTVRWGLPNVPMSMSSW